MKREVVSNVIKCAAVCYLVFSAAVVSDMHGWDRPLEGILFLAPPPELQSSSDLLAQEQTLWDVFYVINEFEITLARFAFGFAIFIGADPLCNLIFRSRR